MKRNVITGLIACVLILIFGLLLFTFQVRVTEAAAVTTFGKPTRQLNKPGIYIKAPWPIQKVYKFDNRVQTFEDKFSQDLTADGNTLMTTVFVGWRITNPEVFFPKFAGGSVAEARRTLENLVRSEKTAAVGQRNLSDFVNANEKDLKFDQIENEIKTRVQSRFDANNYGLKIEFLGIKRLGLPESVTQNVFDRMTKERQKLASKFDSEGNAEASIIRSSADGTALKIRATAEAEAKRIRGEGEAAAAAHLPVFQQNPDLAIFLLGMDALEESLKERATLFLDHRTPPFNLLMGIPPTGIPKGTSTGANK